MLAENITALKHILTNQRLRQDIQSLKAAKACYVWYAWELIEELGIDRQIKTWSSISTISKTTGIKNKIFLETLLDILVGSKNISYKNGKYKLLRPHAGGIEKDLRHLEKYCPGSTKWTHWLRNLSKNTLVTGKKVAAASFDSAKGIDLWEEVMQESPYALRQIAIEQISDKLNRNKKILDVGCGGGIALEEILLKANGKISLNGLEVSKKYLQKARKRVASLKLKLDGTKQENAKNTKYIVKNLVNSPLNQKFDAIIMSLVVNHIAATQHKAFFTNLKSMMNKDSVLVTFQFLNQSKFERSPMWVMHNIPSHKEFPYKAEFINTLKEVFPEVKILFNGIIIVCKLR